MGLLNRIFGEPIPTEGENKIEEPAAKELSSEVDVSRWIQPGAPNPSGWEKFHDIAAIQRWGNDLQVALQAGLADEWELAGPTLVVETDEPADIESLLGIVAAEAGVRLAKVPATDLPDLFPAIRKHFAAIAPVIVMITEEAFASAFQKSPEPSIDKFSRDALVPFDHDAAVMVVMTTESISSMPTELLSYGLFDRQIRLAPLDKEELGKRFLESLGPQVVSDALRSHARKVGLLLGYEHRGAEARQLAHLQLRRKARALGRRLEIDDLIDLSLRGAAEQSSASIRPPSPAQRRKTAYHEAGHACIAVIESNGRAVPDYASIVPARDFAGVVFPSLQFIDGLEEHTFGYLLLRVRISLAGRAAEELVFGSTDVSNGADYDLRQATQLSYAYFAHSGFHPSMARNGVSGMNLAVQLGSEIDPVQNERIAGEVRTFLAEQYAHVMRTLQEHRRFIDAVVDRLMWDPVVDQQEMIELASSVGITIQSGEPVKNV
jgi:hypothetical protein